MILEEIDRRVKIMMTCDRLNSHEWEKGRCHKCGMADYRGYFINQKYDEETVMTIIALTLLDKGISRFIDRIAWAKTSERLTYEIDVAMREYVKKIKENKMNKSIEQKFKTLERLVGLEYGYISHIPPFKEMLAHDPCIINNRYLTKEWLNEAKDIKYADVRQCLSSEKIINPKEFMDIVEYKIKTYGVEEGFGFANIVVNTYEEQQSQKIKIKASLLPFIPAIVMLKSLNYIIKLKSWEILMLYSTYQNVYNKIPIETTEKIINTILKHLLEQQKTITFKPYVYEEDNTEVEINF